MKNFITGSASPRRLMALAKLTALIAAVALTTSACSSLSTANAGYHTEKASPNPHDPTYKIVPDKSSN
ncbi:hypothetical protein [Asticcacaulis excentricus]|uniref:Lipoprotein n=1 Tax=Asticcacaulis excentricus (strain ATCC 15261 / DSM 4724 / KCTC 12464 / NCIMB 9791 / VKM B-1370 / CB 48) TaxID=573065 RepID=E8RW30_ASTEC|nr:hypothetical protein [Asticcacaulis excentricus]ADU15452.1 hypothetical protein Astex_3844 [Asticcacaulis excentricus CB 48]